MSEVNAVALDQMLLPRTSKLFAYSNTVPYTWQLLLWMKKKPVISHTHTTVLLVAVVVTVSLAIASSGTQDAPSWATLEVTWWTFCQKAVHCKDVNWRPGFHWEWASTKDRTGHHTAAAPEFARLSSLCSSPSALAPSLQSSTCCPCFAITNYLSKWTPNSGLSLNPLCNPWSQLPRGSNLSFDGPIPKTTCLLIIPHSLLT